MNVKITVVCFVLAVRACFSTTFLGDYVEDECVEQCSSQKRTDMGGFYDRECGSICNKQCELGCSLWEKALKSQCTMLCNTTSSYFSSKEYYCVMGCNGAVKIYMEQLKDYLGTPPPPALVADSLTSTSLQLEWNYKKAKIDGLTYLVQWIYEEYSDAWQFYKNQTWGPNDTIFTVDNLQPYTKYRFRVAIILFLPNSPAVFSAQSVVIMTHAAGVPISPPSSVRAVPVDCTRISVSWEPGPFPNGPILSYVIRITDSDSPSYSALKDVPAEKNFYMFSSLKPGKTFTVSIGMSNGVGTGPSANCVVTTPKEPAIKDTHGPVLVIGTEHEIVEQGVDIMDEPVTLYSTPHGVKIKGVAIHVKYNLLFISDSNRYVYRMPLSGRANDEKVAILHPSQITFQPLDLSIDWLNEQLYILGEVNYTRKMWTVTRCGLDGRNLTVAVGGLTNKPHHIEVDPYNGYLFWIAHDGIKSGLYRLDLSYISNGIKHENKEEMIYSEPNLGAFIVDHTNFLLLVSNQSNKTVISVSLDGKEKNNVRPRISNSILQKVISIATANKKFYWTDGNQVFFEEYHQQDETYFHNSFNALTKESYLKVIINLPSSQPVPVPINPPTSMQAIFGSGRAKTTWKEPHLLGGQGKGAWQNWSYEIAVKDLGTNEIQTYENINSTSYTMQNLRENTEYIIKAAAYTTSGKGPWSSEFKGRSLRTSKDGQHPVILWSASDGLLKSDATGEQIETLIHQSLMKDYYFTDTAWYKDLIYLVANTSQVFFYNITSHEHGQLANIDSVGSISIDWIGKKMYWSNPKQQLIMRGSLTGMEKEPLPILTIAKELIVDPVKAYLYWSTLNEVECSRLNGADKITYHTAELFSGKQVMGLTLDVDHQFVYWIIRGSEGSNLFRAPMAGSSSSRDKIDETVTSLQKPDMQGPLCYFNNRLLWLQDDQNAVISNMEGRNVALINRKSLLGLNMVYIMDSTLTTLPSNANATIEDITVIPEMVDVNSVTTKGTWESFNLTWKPVESVNYGVVFYEIEIKASGIDDPPETTTVPTIKYWHVLPPFSEMRVLLRAFTYWGSSGQIQLTLHSPSSTPSEPENLRAYVTYTRHHNMVQEVSAVFRWDKPTNSNGVIERYKLSCWYFEEEERLDLCRDVYTTSENKEYVLNDLVGNEIYYFQVQAYTTSEGPSAHIQVNTSVESPLPRLLIASADSIFIQDVDSNENKLVIHGISTPIEMAYSSKENKLFWLNDVKELFMYDTETDSKTKIFDLNGNGVSLTIDWLERSLYYVQTKSDVEGSSVHKLDLNYFDKGIVRNLEIFNTSRPISKIEVSPYTRKLYWIEADENNENRLMEANTDGSGIKAFFANSFLRKRATDEDYPSCNCPVDPTVEKTFTIDHSNTNAKPLVVYVNSSTSEIVSAEKDACFCEAVATLSTPLQTIRSDFDALYWTNSSSGFLYALKKSNGDVTSKERVNATDILIFGAHTQPYPPNKCLTPRFNRNLTVTSEQHTSHSLVLRMPELEMHPGCKGISMATVEYKVYYRTYSEGESMQCDDGCTKIVTFNKSLQINGLKPYTKYVVSVGLSNYYSKFKHKNGYHIGPGTIVQTDVGAPSEPQNITVTVLNPTLAKVAWLPPKEFNADKINYKLYWQTGGATSGISQKGEQRLSEKDISVDDDYHSAFLHNLTPNESYLVWVSAYSNPNEISDSDSIKITTFPEPDDITVVSCTAYALQLQWNVSTYVNDYVIQYTLLTSSNDWTNVPADAIDPDNDTTIILIDNLKPKTQYKFKFSLNYPHFNGMYEWPKDSRFTFETNGDKPSPPGKPEIRFIGGNESKVWWEPSKDNGAPIQLYKLEGLKLRNYRERRSTNRSAWFHTAPSIEEVEFDWEQFYNGSETYWRITGLNDAFRYSFRALALNEYGWSDPSEDTEFDPTTASLMADKPDALVLILVAIFVPLMILLLIIICFACCRWNCGKNKKDHQIKTPIRGPDVELATLRELPRRNNFIHNTNVLYVSAQPTPEEITLLPHIRRDQITLMKFLGSGAFGEVFEGKAKCVSSNEIDTKVAVKTLRKGASHQEKTEFLQEAQLMSHFKHEHILQLLGVCLDNDPHFIIMELMEGGDLLTYLRSSRKVGSGTPSLTLVELLKMCVDVATGCRYLEEMHFVHRDLACRNCLVSSTDPASRIVKIGDFGLARDIYKNDYYRKEGEGLLPVRWMAPESLVDGVFTSQSDAWAFGVLLWEIMTLGQQPYPARNNLEVLHYVRRGGRLGKPTDCPELLHDLMLLCWSYETERRPTFQYCLETLMNLHRQISSSPVTGAHDGQYISTVPEQFDGISNQAYFQDFNHNHSGGSWKSSSEDSSKEQTPFLQQELDEQVVAEVPKYLELVYDSDCPTDNGGYEIPRSSLRSNKSNQSVLEQVKRSLSTPMLADNLKDADDNAKINHT